MKKAAGVKHTCGHRVAQRLRLFAFKQVVPYSWFASRKPQHSTMISVERHRNHLLSVKNCCHTNRPDFRTDKAECQSFGRIRRISSYFFLSP